MASPRNFRPRPPVVLRPSFVSQETAYAILGLTARKFLDAVVPKCQGVTRVGKTALVPIDEAERVVRSLSTDTAPPDDEPDEEHDDEQPTSIDDVLGRLGKERIS